MQIRDTEEIAGPTFLLSLLIPPLLFPVLSLPLFFFLDMCLLTYLHKNEHMYAHECACLPVCAPKVNAGCFPQSLLHFLS